MADVEDKTDKGFWLTPKESRKLVAELRDGYQLWKLAVC